MEITLQQYEEYLKQCIEAYPRQNDTFKFWTKMRLKELAKRIKK